MGVRSTETVQKLCVILNLSLSTAISLCTSQEAEYRDATEIRGADAVVACISNPSSRQQGLLPTTDGIDGTLLYKWNGTL